MWRSSRSRPLLPGGPGRAAPAIGSPHPAVTDRVSPASTPSASAIGMTADAFSRALNDKRQFSSIELARLADQIDTDLHWLITGQLDPHRISVAARHDFDHETRQRTIPGRAGDGQALADIALAYRQAYSEAGQLPDWPESPASVRAMLG